MPCVIVSATYPKSNPGPIAVKFAAANQAQGCPQGPPHHWWHPIGCILHFRKIIFISSSFHDFRGDESLPTWAETSGSDVPAAAAAGDPLLGGPLRRCRICVAKAPDYRPPSTHTHSGPGIQGVREFAD